jgi:F-type H+-transporting ATPase subunit b
MELIDIRQVMTQILGFLLMVWILRRYAWGPLLGTLEARRAKIAGAFADAEKRNAEALELKNRYEQELRGIEAQARQRMQEAIAEGQKVAAEIKTQAHQDASQRMERAVDDIARERDKAKEVLKEQLIRISMRSAEKILRHELDPKTHHKLVDEFITEVEATP